MGRVSTVFFLGWQAYLEEDLLQCRQISNGVFAKTQLFATGLAPKGEVLTHAVPRLIPTCALRGRSKMGEIGHRAQKFRISLKS
jgi:hypothetical protein